MTNVHVIGAGLAGLAAAVRLASRGHKVTVHEGAGHAGGRCRSYFDDQLQMTIDNGNHLLMSANHEALSFLKIIGSEDSLEGPDDAVFPFFDVRTGQHWRVEPNKGLIPWWIFDKTKRVPGTTPLDYLSIGKFAFAGKSKTVDDLVTRDHPLYETFFEPFTIAVLNTSTAKGCAPLLWNVLIRTFAKGADGCRPLVAKEGLSESFVDPALAYLEKMGAAVHFNRRLREITRDGNRVTGLRFTKDDVAVADDDHVVLAIPPVPAQSALPELEVPTEFNAIVNAHMKLPPHNRPNEYQLLLGVIGGTADWIFRRGDIVSLTVSAADELAEKSADEISDALWQDTAKALNLDVLDKPAIRIIKEKRATFAQTPDQVAKRPKTKSKWRHLWLAGDWTDTNLPATIEGAITSGFRAADQIQ